MGWDNSSRVFNINCWNEWTECSCLEPDTVHGLKDLEQSAACSASEPALRTFCAGLSGRSGGTLAAVAEVFDVNLVRVVERPGVFARELRPVRLRFFGGRSAAAPRCARLSYQLRFPRALKSHLSFRYSSCFASVAAVNDRRPPLHPAQQPAEVLFLERIGGLVSPVGKGQRLLQLAARLGQTLFRQQIFSVAIVRVQL